MAINYKNKPKKSTFLLKLDSDLKDASMKKAKEENRSYTKHIVNLLEKDIK